MSEFEPNRTQGVAALGTKVMLGLLCLTLPLPLTATTIFDNSVNNQHGAYSFGQSGEVGDEIQLAGTARLLTNFSFRYFLFVNQPIPHVTARVRLYLNDGPVDFDSYPTPGTVLYDSEWLPVAPTTTASLAFRAGSEFPTEGLFLPSSDITWSIAYQGLGDGETAGLLIYSPPVVGADLPYSWMNAPGAGWFRQISSRGTAMDFEAMLEATEVPEPSPLELSIFAGLVVGLRGLTKRSSGRRESCPVRCSDAVFMLTPYPRRRSPLR